MVVGGADTPDQPPEFISPVKLPPAAKPGENAAEPRADNALGFVQESQERMKHANNLKMMAEAYFRFRPRAGIRVPLKPEHLTGYFAMTDELRKAISDGTYVWYFGWDPAVSRAAERTSALWYDFASRASVYFAGFGAGSLLAGLVLVIKRPNPKLVVGK